MRDGYHLNIARYSYGHAWNSTVERPMYTCYHYASVYLGDDHSDAQEKTAHFRALFPCGDQPDQFVLRLMYWRATGQEIAME